ncbi:cobalamin-dependent protein [Streptomyces sp. NBC_00344]|uniref:cobalamin-dependent protein n=1 Tax=Streptomyces sp. NBC_00344 TaxID=2975720 RepID=UPI002E200139|nr:cobalamin-dependent protein [Streptomyces sp. NBC_00344]
MSGAGTKITDEARTAFDQYLTRADAKGAVALGVRLLEEGTGAEEVLLDLVAPAQVTVGSRWAAGEWTVAREHAATHISQQVVDAVATAARPPEDAATGGDIVVACSDGEWHTLAPRILSEVLRLHGFRVRFLGGHVRPARLIADLHANGPDLAALSCTLPVRLPSASRLFEACRTADVPVLAGGPGFGPGGVWAYTLGADLYAPGARAAVDVLRSQWPPVPASGPTPDHPSTEAYAWLTQQRPELLRGVLERLRLPVHDDDPSDPRFEDVVEQVGYLTDSLAAGVFVDDSRVLTGCLGFLREFLAARSSRPDCLETVLAALSELLRDSPRALAHVAVGRKWLNDRTDGSGSGSG